MNDVALALYNHPESSFNFEGWQEGPYYRLPTLLECYPLSAAAALSTDSRPEDVIDNVPLQFQLQC